MRDGNEITVSNNDFSFFQNKYYIKDGCVNFFMYARLLYVKFTFSPKIIVIYSPNAKTFQLLFFTF